MEYVHIYIYIHTCITAVPKSHKPPRAGLVDAGRPLHGGAEVGGAQGLLTGQRGQEPRGVL